MGSVQSHTITLDKNGIENIFSVGRESLAKRNGEVDQLALAAEHNSV